MSFLTYHVTSMIVLAVASPCYQKNPVKVTDDAHLNSTRTAKPQQTSSKIDRSNLAKLWQETVGNASLIHSANCGPKDLCERKYEFNLSLRAAILTVVAARDKGIIPGLPILGRK